MSGTFGRIGMDMDGHDGMKHDMKNMDEHAFEPEKTVGDAGMKMDGHDNVLSHKAAGDHMDMTHMDHMGHMNHMGNLKQKFWVSLIVAIPIFLLSPMMGLHLPFQLSFKGSDWVVLALATFLFFYGGKPFFNGAVDELKNRRPAMMTLIFMGISVAYFYSLYAFIANRYVHSTVERMDFFWELASLIVIMLLGHWLEMRAVGDAGDALKKMAQLLPSSAHLVTENGKTVEVAISTVKIGDTLMVRAGEKIPADGKIVSGHSSVNESMVTGEAKAIAVKPGDKVIGGSINGDGTIEVQVSGTGESGYLAQVMKLVGDAQKEKSKAENLSDKVARALFYVALGIGLLAFVVWFVLTGSLNVALERLVTVLIIACPHALGLAIPLVVARSTSLGASNGLLIRNRHAVEEAGSIRIATMDKTGTLTEGNFAVSTVISLANGWDENRVLGSMAALESASGHPLAVGILTEAKKRNLDIPKAENVSVMEGTGLSGTVGGQALKIVSAAYLDQRHLAYSEKQFSELSSSGNSLSYLLDGDNVVGLIAQGDRIKPDAKKTVDALKTMGIEPVMLTGDNEGFARAVAGKLGIARFYAQLLPQAKEKIIADFQKEGKAVMMVGDGVNDAPALAKANIGIAIGAGTDVAIDSAQVILVKSDPYDIVHFLNLAKRTTGKMVQNLWWGAGYNVVAIPLAAGILAPVGVILSPAVGAILMSISTIVVAINAMTLKME